MTSFISSIIEGLIILLLWELGRFLRKKYKAGAFKDSIASIIDRDILNRTINSLNTEFNELLFFVDYFDNDGLRHEIGAVDYNRLYKINGKLDDFTVAMSEKFMKDYVSIYQNKPREVIEKFNDFRLLSSNAKFNANKHNMHKIEYGIAGTLYIRSRIEFEEKIEPMQWFYFLEPRSVFRFKLYLRGIKQIIDKISNL